MPKKWCMAAERLGSGRAHRLEAEQILECTCIVKSWNCGRYAWLIFGELLMLWAESKWHTKSMQEAGDHGLKGCTLAVLRIAIKNRTDLTATCIDLVLY